jgi:hypothetical protein
VGLARCKKCPGNLYILIETTPNSVFLLAIFKCRAIFISNTTRGYEIAEIFDLIIRVFVSTTIVEKTNTSKMGRKISRNFVPSSCIRHDNSTKENFIFKFYTFFLIYTYCYDSQSVS